MNNTDDRNLESLLSVIIGFLSALSLLRGHYVYISEDEPVDEETGNLVRETNKHLVNLYVPN